MLEKLSCCKVPLQPQSQPCRRNLVSLTPRVNISVEDSENTFGSTIEGIFFDMTPFYFSVHPNTFPKYFIIILYCL